MKRIDLFGGQSFWYCDDCRAHGPVVFEKDDTISGAADRIKNAHAKASPKCKNPRSVRVVDAIAFAKLETRQ